MFFLALLLSTLLLRCQSNASELADTDSQAETRLPAEQFRTKVEMARAEEKVFLQEIEISGIIQARQQADVVWETSDIIEKVQVKNGQLVEKGQVLAVVENQEEKLQLRKAEITLKEKQVSYESESLGADSLRKQYLEYHTGLAMANVSLEEAQLAMGRTLLRAPISGRVSDLRVSAGSRARAGEIFCHLWNPTHLEFVGSVMETQFSSLQAGQEAMVQPLGSSTSYAAVLQEVNPRVNEHGLVEVTLALEETGNLWPGKHAKANIKVSYRKTIVIPKAALVLRSGRPVVFTYASGLAKWHYVETGLENATEVEITDGIQAGDSVITSNNLQLDHDSHVVLTRGNEKKER